MSALPLALAPRSFDDLARAERPELAVAVAGRELLLAQDAAAGIPGVVYDCAFRMAAFATRVVAAERPGARCVELGAGCGLVGLAAAAAGLRVRITDRSPAALALAARSVEANALAGAAEVSAYAFGDPVPPEWGPPPDVVLACETVYAPEALPLLKRSLVELLAADGSEAFVGFKKRNRAREQALLRLLGSSGELQVEAWPWTGGGLESAGGGSGGGLEEQKAGEQVDGELPDKPDELFVLLRVTRHPPAPVLLLCDGE